VISVSRIPKPFLIEFITASRRCLWVANFGECPFYEVG
jgi:hypothetical protein